MADDVQTRIDAARARIAAWRVQLKAEQAAAKAEAERRQFWAKVDAKANPVLTFKERTRGQ